MSKNLHILMLDDDPGDVSLAAHALREGGVECSMVRVESEADFVHELESHRPDVILSDHGLPSFDGMAALTLSRTRTPEIPFILVSGTQSNSAIATALKNGATGFVPKNRLDALAPLIEHAVQINEERAAWKAAEAEYQREVQDLQKALESIKMMEGLVHVCSHCKMMKDENSSDWMRMEKYLQQHSQIMLSHGICPDCAKSLYAEYIHEQQ